MSGITGFNSNDYRNYSSTSSAGSASSASSASSTGSSTGKFHGDYWAAVSAGVAGKLKVGDTFQHQECGRCIVTRVSQNIGGCFSWRKL